MYKYILIILLLFTSVYSQGRRVRGIDLMDSAKDSVRAIVSDSLDGTGVIGWDQLSEAAKDSIKQIISDSLHVSLIQLNDSLYYFVYPTSVDGDPIYYWWASNSGYIYIITDSLGNGIFGDPEAVGMIKVDSLGDGSLHQYVESANTYCIYPDSALRLDLPNDFVVANPAVFTVELWVKRETNGVKGRLWHNGANIYETFYPQGSYDSFFFDGPAGGCGTLGSANLTSTYDATTINVWCHYVLMADTVGVDSIWIYEGGTVGDDSLGTWGIWEKNMCIDIGQLFANTSNLLPYDGKMDELRMWNKRRTLSEINANKLTELSNSDTVGLKYYYQFNGNLESSTTKNTLTEAWGTAKYDADTPF